MLVALIATLGGFVFWAGRPPYANEEATQLKFWGYELRYSEQRADNLARRIFDLEVEKAKARKTNRGFPVFMEKELRRLKKLERIEEKKIEALIEKGKK